jgi:heme exporter protein A
VSVERFRYMLAAHRAGGGLLVAATHLPLPLSDTAELRLQ